MQSRNRLTDFENKLMVARREKWEEGIVEEFGVCKMHTKQGPTVLYMEFCSILCGSLDKRAVWGNRVSCICMAESLLPFT